MHGDPGWFVGRSDLIGDLAGSDESSASLPFIYNFCGHDLAGAIYMFSSGPVTLGSVANITLYTPSMFYSGHKIRSWIASNVPQTGI